MEISDFKDLDICNIIKTCAESGVRHLSLGQLNISFQQVGIPVSPVWSGMTHNPPTPGTVADQVKSLALSDEDRELLDELQETQTMMDDPVQWEQDMIDKFMQTNDGVVDERSRHNQTEPALSGV